MANRKVAVKQAVAESVKAAKEAPTASVVKKDKPVAKKPAVKPAPKKPARKYAEPKKAVEPKVITKKNTRVRSNVVKTGLTPGQQASKTRVASARVTADERRKSAAAQEAGRAKNRVERDPNAPVYKEPEMSVADQAAQVARMYKNGTLKKFLLKKKR
jgi:hypothetical protein